MNTKVQLCAFAAHFAQWARRAGTKTILSAMVLLFAAAFAPTARAVTVTVQYKGTVASGSSDSSSANVFGLGTDLSGYDFTLTMTYDDSKATNAYSDCYDGSMYASKITGSGTSFPAVVTLKISSGSSGNTFTFGSGNNTLSSVNWEADRTGVTGYCGSGSSLYAYYYEVYSGGEGYSYVNGYSYPTSSYSSNDWRWLLGLQNLTNASSIGFLIDVWNGYTLTKSSSGSLSPTTVTVTGPACDIPNYETSTYTGSWDGPHAVYSATLADINPNSTTSFNGAQVREQAGPSGTDTCYSQDSSAGSSQWITLSAGSPWTVNTSPFGNNQYGYDSVGWGSGDVTNYRTAASASHVTLPCLSTIYQQMQMYCPADSTWYNYGGNNSGTLNTLKSDIYSQTQLTGQRGNSSVATSNQ